VLQNYQTSCIYQGASPDAPVSLKQMNIMSLLELSKKYEIFTAFTNLPYLSRYIARHQAALLSLSKKAERVLALPSSVKDVNALYNE